MSSNNNKIQAQCALKIKAQRYLSKVIDIQKKYVVADAILSDRRIDINKIILIEISSIQKSNITIFILTLKQI